MKNKPTTTLESADTYLAARQLERSALAAKLITEAERYQQLATDLIVKSYHSGAVMPATERLIRDHEIRAESFRAAAQLAIAD